jgi:pyridoxine/pyridoxamine 5'-phosphate oxidase
MDVARAPSLTDLADVQNDLWGRLARAARDRRSAWHLPALATVAADGAPHARILVLRRVAREARQLRLHTDVRTAKVAELAAEPRVALLFYDSGARLQLRVGGTASILASGPEVEEAWLAARPFSRRCYTAPLAPGTVADAPVSGLPAALETREPTLEESEAGRPNFAIVQVEVERLEFLHLAFTGHRRGLFRFDAATGTWAGTWLIP